MNDYKELVKQLRVFCLPCHGEEKSIGQSAADVIEHLQSKCERLENDYKILAKMYAKVNEDLCVRTKERDAAVADIFVGCATCRHSYLNNPSGKLCDRARECVDDYNEQWEWRGVQGGSDGTI